MIPTTQTWKIGDCMELLPGIETGSIDMILCDLPYGMTACAWDTIIPFKPLWKEWNRLIADNGAIVLTASQPFTSKLIMSNLDMFKYCWIWEKNGATGYLNAKKRPMKNYEDVCMFYKKQPTYNPQLRHAAPYKKPPYKNTYAGYSSHSPVYQDNNGFRLPTSIIRSDVEQNEYHPTQKPVALFEYLIKTYTNEGDTVHDSCLGSGTTLEACRKTNRNCIGFEISDEWEKHYADRAMSHTPTLQSYM